MNGLKWWISIRVILSLSGHLAMSTDIFGCHNWEGRVRMLLASVGRDQRCTGQLLPPLLQSTTKHHPDQNGHSVEDEKP